MQVAVTVTKQLFTVKTTVM